MKNYLPLISCVALLSVLQSCTNNSKKDNTPKLSSALEKPLVDTLRARPTNFSKEVLSNGKLEAFDKASVRFRTTGQIAEILVKTGDFVRKGELLATLDNSSMVLALQKSSLNLEKTLLNFKDVLIGQGYNPDDTASVPATFLNIAKIKSGYADALIAHKEASEALAGAKLYAPFDGVVANLTQKVHEFAGTGEPFCTLINNHDFYVRFSLLESEIGDAKTGKPIFVTTLSGEIIEGSIEKINPTVDINGLVTVWGRIQNGKHGLIDGMNVRLTLLTNIPNRISVPKSAVLQRQNRQVVFTLKNDSVAIWNYVKTDHENSTHYAIAEGLNPNDIVIVQGGLNLAHESVVAIKPRK